jgi:hypothetical protein
MMVSEASAVSPPGRETLTDTLVGDPAAPAVSVMVSAPTPENSGRGLPSTLHEKSAKSLSNVGVAAVTENVARGAGDDGEEERETGGGIICARAVAQNDTTKQTAANTAPARTDIRVERNDIMIFLPDPPLPV